MKRTMCLLLSFVLSISLFTLGVFAEEKELWLLYRQYLRDITKDPAFPNVDVLNFANWLGQIHSKEPVLKA